MILLPPAKINIGLYVTAVRPDGFHDIETLFHTVPLHDVLEIIPATAQSRLPEAAPGCRFGVEGLVPDGDPADNLCVKAWRLLAADYPLPPVEMLLLKNLPAGAGLGGGSADATYTLLGLNRLFSLGLSQERLEDYAARLGSDCAFFVSGTPAVGTGRGEVLTPVPVSLKGLSLVLVVPPAHVSTAEAYRNVPLRTPSEPLGTLLSRPVSEWQRTVENDFEKTVFRAHPEIAAVKETLLRKGAVYAAMSGSGSSVYGLFAEKPDVTGWFTGQRMVATVRF